MAHFEETGYHSMFYFTVQHLAATTSQDRTEGDETQTCQQHVVCVRY